MAEKWTKTSAVPPSGVMKPKPFSPLNHFTVPCAMFSPDGCTYRRRKVTITGSLGRRGPPTPDARWTRVRGRPRTRERRLQPRPTISGSAPKASQAALGRLDDVGEEHRPGHRPDAARHGSDPARDVVDVGGDVADEPGALPLDHAGDPDVQHHGSRFHH